MNADSKLYAQIKDDELVLCFHVLYIFFFIWRDRRGYSLSDDLYMEMA